MIWTVMEAVCYISFHSAENTTLMKMLILFQVLVTAGIDINIQRTITEETALHQAIVYKKVHVVKALQKYGARTDTSIGKGIYLSLLLRLYVGMMVKATFIIVLYADIFSSKILLVYIMRLLKL